MLTISLIKRVWGGPICRSCINEQFHVALEREDCKYEKHSGLCPRCKKKSHIVKRLKFRGYLKVLWK